MHYKEAILIVCLILFCLWFTAVMCISWNRWEDKYYARKVITEPDEHSYCVACGRPRPHKKMGYTLENTLEKAYGKHKAGNTCDEHFEWKEVSTGEQS